MSRSARADVLAMLYDSRRNRTRDAKDPTAKDLFLNPDDELFTEDHNDAYRCKLIEYTREYHPDQPITDQRLFLSHQEYKGSEHYKDWKYNNFPLSVLLSQFLVHDISVTNSWLTPDPQSIRFPNYYRVYDVSILSFDKEDFDFGVNTFNDYLQEQRVLRFDANPVTFAVQTIKIPREAYEEIKEEKYRDVTFDWHEDVTDCVEVPAKIILGAGISFCLVISLGFVEVETRKDGVKTFTFMQDELPLPVLRFLDNLPLLYSSGAKHQLDCLTRVLSDLYNVRLDLRVFDIGALAVACGYKAVDYSLCSILHMVGAALFPSFVEGFDNGWAGDLTEIMKDYLKSKCRNMYNLYNVLMACFVRNVFPDPDIVLTVMEMSQDSFLCWFTEFVGSALCDANVHADIHKEPTRSEMIMSLDCGNALSSLLGDLIPNIPTLPYGGGRFLHHARNCFAIQYHALRKINLPMYSGEVPNLTKNLDDEMYRLLFNRDYVNDSGYSVDGPGLHPNPTFEVNIYKLDIYEANVLNLEPQYHRNLIPAVLEWGRLNPKKIPELFKALRKADCNELAYFWLPKIRLYEGLSNIYLHIFNRREIVAILDKSITLRRENVASSYAGTEARRILDLQKQRVDLLNHHNRASSAQRVGVHQKVHDAIPGNFTEENRVKNAKRKRRWERAKYWKGHQFVPRNTLRNEKYLSAIKGQGHSSKVSKPQIPSKPPKASALRPGDLRHFLRVRDEPPQDLQERRFATGQGVLAYHEELKAMYKKQQSKKAKPKRH